MEFPAKRPEQKTTLGNTITVESNLLPLLPLPKTKDTVVHAYLLTFSPAVHRRLLFPFFNRIKRGPREDEEKEKATQFVLPEDAIFDGTSLVLTHTKFDDCELQLETGKGPVKATLAHKHTMDLADVAEDRVELASMLIDAVVRFHQANNFITDGKQSYSKRESRTLSEGLTAWGGLSQKATMTSIGTFLNVDMAVCVFYDDISLIDLAERRGGIRLRDEETLLRLADFVRHCHCTTTHRERNPKFKISGFKWSAATITFEHEGSQVSIANYFGSKYRPLRYPDYPVAVVTRGGNETYVPLEVIKIASGQRYPKKLDERQTADMIKFAAKGAKDRFETIKGYVEELEVCENPVLKSYGLGWKKEFTKVNATVLKPPTLVCNAESRGSGHPSSYTINPANGSWNLRGCSALKGVTITSATCVTMEKIDKRTLSSGLIEMSKVGSRYGVTLPRQIDIFDITGVEQFRAHLRTQRPQICFVILMNRSASLYSLVKRVAETEFGIVTQCLFVGNVVKLSKPAFASNILIKVNAKLGGVNWTVNPTEIEKKNTMVIGCDVTHPGIGNLDSPSISAIVATQGSKLSDGYNTVMRNQERRVEIVSGLEGIVKELVMKFNKGKTGGHPSNILFFRDGVGESQFYPVFQNEIDAIRKALDSLGCKNTKICFIIAQKRHSVRFLSQTAGGSSGGANRGRDGGYGGRDSGRDNQGGDNSGNVPVGTIVDSLGTKSIYDFYVVAHYALQGTARPVRYQVLLNECAFSRDEIYEFINNFSYCYARATKAVSVVPAIYYAHLAAARAACYIYKDKDGKMIAAEHPKTLMDKLYYV